MLQQNPQVMTHFQVVESVCDCGLQEKNVSTDMLEGKVARVYVPKQNLDTIALRKTKGSKRERRNRGSEAAAASAAGNDRPVKQPRTS